MAKTEVEVVKDIHRDTIEELSHILATAYRLSDKPHQAILCDLVTQIDTALIFAHQWCRNETD